MSESVAASTGQTFALEHEDHTLANALRFMLNKNPHVTFCGYSMPHPSDDVVNIRVQTTGEISPVEALRQACQQLKEMCAHIKGTFEQAWAEFEAQQPEPQPAPGNAAVGDAREGMAVD